MSELCFSREELYLRFLFVLRPHIAALPQEDEGEANPLELSPYLSFSDLGMEPRQVHAFRQELCRAFCADIPPGRYPGLLELFETLCRSLEI